MLSLEEVLAHEYDCKPETERQWANISLKFGICFRCGHRNKKFKSKSKTTKIESIILDAYFLIPGNKMPEIKSIMPKKIGVLWHSVCSPCAKFIEAKK